MSEEGYKNIIKTYEIETNDLYKENSQLKEDIKGFEQERQTLYNTIHDLQKANKQLNRKIEKAIEYMKPRFMNCIDDVNKKRYFEDYYIQEIYEILKGDKE